MGRVGTTIHRLTFTCDRCALIEVMEADTLDWEAEYPPGQPYRPLIPNTWVGAHLCFVPHYGNHEGYNHWFCSKRCRREFVEQHVQTSYGEYLK
jgi:endogenous inhibitor of DNA gyrase (YacG/DUF329 family)